MIISRCAEFVIIPARKVPSPNDDNIKYHDDYKSGWYTANIVYDNERSYIQCRDSITMTFHSRESGYPCVVLKGIRETKGQREIMISKKRSSWEDINTTHTLFEESYYLDHRYGSSKGNRALTHYQVEALFDANGLSNGEITGETALRAAKRVYMFLCVIDDVDVISKFFPDEYKFRLNQVFKSAVYVNDFALANKALKLGAQIFNADKYSEMGPSSTKDQLLSLMAVRNTSAFNYVLSKIKPDQYGAELGEVMIRHVDRYADDNSFNVAAMKALVKKGAKPVIDLGSKDVDSYSYHPLRYCYMDKKAPELIQLFEQAGLAFDDRVVLHGLSSCHEVVVWAIETKRMKLTQTLVSNIIAKGHDNTVRWLFDQGHHFTGAQCSSLINRTNSKKMATLVQEVLLKYKFDLSYDDAKKIKNDGDIYHLDTLYKMGVSALLAHELQGTQR